MHFKNSCHQRGVQFSYEIILGGYSFHTPHLSDPPPPPPRDVINDRSLILGELAQLAGLAWLMPYSLAIFLLGLCLSLI